MAFQKAIGRECTGIRADFPHAYWRIEEIFMGIDNGEMCINFCLNAYPDIEASHYEPDADIVNLGFGSNLHFSERFIYRWHTTHPWSEVSTDSIPLTQAALREKLYPFVKSINPFFADAIDIIEEDIG